MINDSISKSDQLSFKNIPAKRMKEFEETVLNACRQHMAENDLKLPEHEEIIVDGLFHRYSSDSNQNKLDEWYVSSINEFDSGETSFICTYGSFSNGTKYTYSSVDDKINDYSDQERKEFKKAAAKHKKLTEKRIQEQHDLAAKTAKNIWANSFDSLPTKESYQLPSYSDFPLYEQKKKIKTYGAKYNHNPIDKRGSLIKDIIDIDGKIHSLQYIWIMPDGSSKKYFLTWGKLEGNFSLLGKLVNGEPITVCEGYATQCSIFEAKEKKEAIVAALFAKNISAVVKILRKTFPDSDITIAADNDIEKKENTGKNAAIEAAQKFGCKIALPEFPKDKSHDPSDPNKKLYTDFNDLHSVCGIDEVKKQLKEFLYLKPVINIDDESKLTEIIDEAEVALAQNKESGIFQRYGILVRIIKVPDKPVQSVSGKETKKIERDTGSIIIKSVDQNYLVEQLTNCVSFQKHVVRFHNLRQVSCPRRYAEHLLSRGEWTQINVLTGIINTPMVFPNGTILETPGYDKHTGLFFNPNGTVFNKIPDNPSKDDARQSMKIIDELIKDFPFVSEVDKSVAIAALFTAVLRPSIRIAPITAFTAPTMSSGKSLLCDIAAAIATGKNVSKLTYTGNPDEDKKLLLTVLEGGDPVICYDNIVHPFGFDALDTVITEATYKGRRLGKTEDINISNIKASVFANGNNLRIKGDTTTRAILCRIDAKQEHPEERKFNVDLRKYVSENRNHIVEAILTTVRAYLNSGEKADLKSRYSRFEEWDSVVRSPISWLGYGDPYISRDEIDDADPEREEIRSLLVSWYNVFGEMEMKVSDLINPQSSIDQKEEDRESIFQALRLIAGNSKSAEINARTLGNKLKSYKDRRELGYVLTIARKNQASVWWKVVKTSKIPE